MVVSSATRFSTLLSIARLFKCTKLGRREIGISQVSPKPRIAGPIAPQTLAASSNGQSWSKLDQYRLSGRVARCLASCRAGYRKWVGLSSRAAALPRSPSSPAMLTVAELEKRENEEKEKKGEGGAEGEAEDAAAQRQCV